MDELNDFGLFKKYIKDFFIENEELFRLVWFSHSSPLDEVLCSYPDSPYQIFEESSEHGCVLFRPKNDIVQMNEGTNILITYYSVPKGNSKFINSVFVQFDIINKGENVQELSDGTNRTNAIAEIINNYMNEAKITNIDYMKCETYKEIPINEQNSAMRLVYSTTGFSHKRNENKNFIHGMRKKW